MRDYVRLSGLQQIPHYLSWGELTAHLLRVPVGQVFRTAFFTKTNFLVYFITSLMFEFAFVGWTLLLEIFPRKGSSVCLVAFNTFIYRIFLRRWANWCMSQKLMETSSRESVTGILGLGWGSSTTLRLLSTPIFLTSCDVRMYGKSMLTDKLAISQTLGLCPQYVYYDLLPAAEHADLFAALKSMPKDDCGAEVEQLLKEAGLTGAVN